MATFVSQRSGVWSLASNNAASPWYDGGTQTALARVPGNAGNTDAVTIGAAHTVTYDYAMTTGTVGITLSGVLVASTTAGAYQINLTSDLAIATTGQLLAGTAGTAYPATCEFTISSNGASKITLTGSAVCALYCTQPTWSSVKIAAASIGDTTLNVTTWVTPAGVEQTGQDLTTSPTWASPREVRVDNVNKAADSEVRVISSVTSNTVVLTAGLTASKIAGTYIHLCYRNIRLTGYTGTAGIIVGGTGAVLTCEGKSGGSSAYGIVSGTSHSVGGVWHGWSRCASSGSKLRVTATLTGCAISVSGGMAHLISGVISGSTSGCNSGTGHTMSGVIAGCTNGLNTSCNFLVSGAIIGCTYAAIMCIAVTISGSISGCTTAIMNGSLALTDTAVISDCSNGFLADAFGRATCTGHGATISANTQYSGNSTTIMTSGATGMTVIWDIAGVPGAVKAWMGGVVDSSAADPTGWTGPSYTTLGQIYRLAPAWSDYPCYLDKPLYVRAGQPVRVTMHCVKTVNGMIETPSVQLIDPNDVPFSASSVLASATMADTTAGQALVLTDYTPTYDRFIILRFRCTHTSGSVYFREVVDMPLTSTDIAAVASAVWEEPLTGATHNVPTSAGRRLRQVAAAIIIDGTARSATSNTIQLGTDASSTDGAYDPGIIWLTGGTGAGQCRLIYQYDGANRIAVVDRGWKTLPDATSTYVIGGDAGREHVNEGLIRSATSVTARLNANASSVDGAYVGQVIFIRSGTGEDQARRVTGYVGSTQTATVATWDVTPDATSAYVMLPTALSEAHSTLTDQQIRDAMKLAPSAGLAAAGSVDDLLADLYNVPAATVASILAGTDLTLVRNATVSFTVSGMGNISDMTSLAFTMKAASNLDDAYAYLKIVKVVSPASNGITRINKAAPATGTTGDGTITIDDASAGVVTIDLAARSAALLPLTTCIWDIVRWDSAGEKHIEASGAAVIQSTATASAT